MGNKKHMVICENAEFCENADCEHIIPHKEENNCTKDECGDPDYFPESICQQFFDLIDKSNMRW